MVITPDRPPWELQLALARGEPVTLHVTDGTCEELAYLCRASCCVGWDEIPVATQAERQRLADVTEDAKLNPVGAGRMKQVGEQQYCILNNPATCRCERYEIRPTCCREAHCQLYGKSLDVTVRLV